MLTNVKAWWRDADALLTELDALDLEQVGWWVPAQEGLAAEEVWDLADVEYGEGFLADAEPVYRLRVNGGES